VCRHGVLEQELDRRIAAERRGLDDQRRVGYREGQQRKTALVGNAERPSARRQHSPAAMVTQQVRHQIGAAVAVGIAIIQYQ